MAYSEVLASVVRNDTAPAGAHSVGDRSFSTQFATSPLQASLVTKVGPSQIRSSPRDQGELLKIGPVAIDREEAVIERDSRVRRSPSAEV
jgi:hypothetical protein